MAIRIKNIIIIILSVMLFSVWQVYAGNPTGPGTPPDSTSSYTLNDIYARLEAGTAGSQSTFTEPSVAPGTSTTHTLNEIMGAAPAVDDTNGATAAEVATGKNFWGLTTNGWGVQTGSANFSGGGSTGVRKTGQTTCYDAAGTTINCAGTGQDGDHQAGVEWPTPRFTDNSDGTVTDNLTGLIWLKNANCFGTQTWANALSRANGLANGNCGLTDGSMAGDWRLPNRRELYSLIDLSQSNPAFPSGHPFSGVQSNIYRSSSTYRGDTTLGWLVNLNGGNMNKVTKSHGGYVWPVRGGQ